MNSAAGDLKLVHYGKRTSPERMDRAAAVMQAILAYRNRNSSADKREEILRLSRAEQKGRLFYARLGGTLPSSVKIRADFCFDFYAEPL
jgi:hypothetical protein